MNNIEQRLRELIAQTFEINETDLPSEPSVETVDQWDSLGHLKVIVAVETEFGLKFQTTKIPNLTSLALLRTEIEHDVY
jgi:acyl carrier protein